MKKKVLVLFILLLVTVAGLFALSVADEAEEHDFDSLVMLNKWNFNPEIQDREFWENCQVKLLTISKADPLYSWFGHCALLIVPPKGEGDEIMYDWGVFAFSDEFYLNFALGRLWYNCEASYAKSHLKYVMDDKRTISAVTLNLSPEKKKAVIDYVWYNSRVENSTYLYHHYKDNCATRIRDIVDYATDGEFGAWAKAQEGNTYRQEASRALANSSFFQWCLDFLQSGNIDRENSRWEEMFLPENLEKAVLEFPGLALDQEYISDFRGKDGRPDTFSTPQNNLLYPALAGAVLAMLCLVFLCAGCRVPYSILTFIVNLFLGLAGLLLLFMMCFTSHDVSWWNENILFINPFLLVLAFSAFGIGKKRKREKQIKTSYRVLFFTLIALAFVKVIFGSFFVQQNWSQILAIFPYYLVNAFVPLKKNA